MKHFLKIFNSRKHDYRITKLYDKLKKKLLLVHPHTLEYKAPFSIQQCHTIDKE